MHKTVWTAWLWKKVFHYFCPRWLLNEPSENEQKQVLGYVKPLQRASRQSSRIAHTLPMQGTFAPYPWIIYDTVKTDHCRIGEKYVRGNLISSHGLWLLLLLLLLLFYLSRVGVRWHLVRIGHLSGLRVCEGCLQCIYHQQLRG